MSGETNNTLPIGSLFKNGGGNGENGAIVRWLVGILGTALVGMCSWLLGSMQKDAEKLGGLEQRLYGLERRLDHIDGKLDHLIERRDKP